MITTKSSVTDDDTPAASHNMILLHGSKNIINIKFTKIYLCKNYSSWSYSRKTDIQFSVQEFSTFQICIVFASWFSLFKNRDFCDLFSLWSKLHQIFRDSIRASIKFLVPVNFSIKNSIYKAKQYQDFNKNFFVQSVQNFKINVFASLLFLYQINLIGFSGTSDWILTTIFKNSQFKNINSSILSFQAEYTVFKKQQQKVFSLSPLSGRLSDLQIFEFIYIFMMCGYFFLYYCRLSKGLHSTVFPRHWRFQFAKFNLF